MGKSFWILAAVVAAASPAVAQQAPQWVRLSLDDGRFVDGYITGGDAANYFVQTSYGYFSILRTNVVAVTPMAQQAPQPQPQPQYAPPPQYAPRQYAPPPQYAPPQPMAPPSEGQSDGKATGRVAGFLYFGVSYGITAMVASAKVDDDPTAKAGYIPVVGPIMWAFADDEDDVGEDGWDWLAALGTLTQGLGVYMIITGETGAKSSKVKVSAVSTKHYSGLAIGGRF